MLDLAHRWLAAQRDSAVISNIFGELPGGGFDGAAEIATTQEWNHCAAGVPSARIVDNWLHAVTYFDPVFAFVGGDQ